MGYQTQALIGLSWVGVFRGFLRSFSLLRTIILARLLSPTDFGIFGIAAIVLGLLEMLTETGVNVVLIQEEAKDTDRYLNTAFTVSLLRGVLIAGLIFISIPLVVIFYREPAVVPLLVLTCLIPITRGFINPAVVKFQQQLRFKQEFLFRSGILIADAAVAIITAFLLRSPVSLVLGILAGVMVEVIISHLVIRPRSHLEFDPKLFSHLLHQGKWITGAGVFSYLASRVPDITLGKLLSTTALGYYQMAYRFSVMPIDELVETFNRVAFPVYRLIRHDRHRLQRALLKNVAGFWLLTTSISLCIFVFAPYVIPLILGPQWQTIIPHIRLLTLTSVLIAVSTPVNPLYLATKHQAYLTYTTLFQFFIIALIIIPFTQAQGVSGAIIALSLSIALTLPLRWYYAYKSLYS